MSPTVNRLQRASNHEIKTAKNRLSRVNVLRAWSDNDIGLAKRWLEVWASDLVENQWWRRQSLPGSIKWQRVPARPIATVNSSGPAKFAPGQENWKVFRNAQFNQQRNRAEWSRIALSQRVTTATLLTFIPLLLLLQTKMIITLCLALYHVKKRNTEKLIKT